jgi:hypothetical protein
MKCVCGYEYEAHFDYDKLDFVVDKGDEKFAEIRGCFWVGGWLHGHEDQVTLFACPKCNTVQMRD